MVKVIEQEMGKDEFDASDRGMVYRTTGGKHKYIMGDCNVLVADSVDAFRNALREVLTKPYAGMDVLRRIGSLEKVLYQLKLVDLCVKIAPKDSMDVWKYAGNETPGALVDMPLDVFLKTAKRLKIA